MFWICNDEDLDIKKRILKNYNVIDEQGNIITPILGIDQPVENHPGLTSDFGIEIQKLINEFKEKETHQKNNKVKEK